jgi:hypothetical protein
MAFGQRWANVGRRGNSLGQRSVDTPARSISSAASTSVANRIFLDLLLPRPLG